MTSLRFVPPAAINLSLWCQIVEWDFRGLPGLLGHKLGALHPTHETLHDVLEICTPCRLCAPLLPLCAVLEPRAAAAGIHIEELVPGQMWRSQRPKSAL